MLDYRGWVFLDLSCGIVICIGFYAPVAAGGGILYVGTRCTVYLSKGGGWRCAASGIGGERSKAWRGFGDGLVGRGKGTETGKQDVIERLQELCIGTWRRQYGSSHAENQKRKH